MFKRGSGPLVSVLMPTRGRSQWLCESVDSLYSLAQDPSCIEFLFKVDSDDSETLETISRMGKVLPCTTLISPRGSGYMELNKFINALSGLAKGDWLFIFNDDAKMITQGWDQHLLNVDPWKVPGWLGNDDICLLGPSVVERETSWEFPILRRKTFEVLGHFSLNHCSDTYIYWVASSVNAAVVMPQIQISHFVNEIDDVVKHEGKLAADKYMKDLHSVETMSLIERDKAVLMVHLMDKK